MPWAYVVPAVATLLAAYIASQSGGKQPAPAPGSVGGGNKQPFSVPEVFGDYSLLNGNRPRLSESLAGESNASPQYGPRQMSPFDEYAIQQQAQGWSKGK